MNLCSTNATEGENASIQGYSHCLEVSSILLAVFGVKGFFLIFFYYNETQLILLEIRVRQFCQVRLWLVRAIDRDSSMSDTEIS